MRDADSFKIDFIKMGNKDEDEPLTITGQLRIGDAVEGVNADITIFFFPLDLFLEKVENADAFIISYDDVSLMHSLHVFKEQYYDDLKDFMKIYKEKHK